ncbi:hypothetical protein [Spirosoma radiotolerans]|uniref:Uncharacterized protein n=1 Tax=Spirosoma radiotolerans TaxID=1379870 RepID=A0A0E3ZXN3_9BACT|nr:hypothetical protein [Spirosoma radiotolerans]AKD56315.1 hypothetical protein SD10_16810 [Spirosoma radiotolerans]
METIYNWLLQSMGNEGNAYTILNCQRTKRTEGGDYIQVMARLKDFSIVNLLIHSGQLTEPEANRLGGGNPAFEQHTFADSTGVLDFLHTGETDDVPTSTDNNAVQVLVFKPVGEAGELTFPPEQSAD